MEPVYFIAPIAAVLGGLAAWFSRGGLARPLVICTAILALGFIPWMYFASTDAPPWYTMPAVLIHADGLFLMAFIMLAWLPSVLGVILGLALRQSLKKNVKHEKS
jgi:hypothetical protein